MITLEMLELPNFSQMSTLKYDLSHVMKFIGDVMSRSYDIATFILNYCRF